MKIRFIQKIIDKIRNKKVRFVPASVTIEISGSCNAKCTYCCRGSDNHKVDKKFMTAIEFETILNRLILLRMLRKRERERALWKRTFI